MKYPAVDYPTIVAGMFWADTLRLESLTGPELFIAPKDLQPGGWQFKDGLFTLNDFRPRDINGHTYAVTHQQKQSTHGPGWLRAEPYCRHFWWTISPQKRDATGKWIPGSEIVKYFRWGDWRWDVPGTSGNHWIGGENGTTYINFSLHWD